MKALSSQLTARLENWRNRPWPIHRFVRVNFSHTSTPQWRTWSTYPHDITVDGFSYAKDNKLYGVGQARLTDTIGKHSFTFSVFDDDPGSWKIPQYQVFTEDSSCGATYISPRRRHI